MIILRSVTVILFDPLTINKLQLQNRFVRSATYDNLADQGTVSDAQLSLYDTLSRGEIGLIVSAGFYPTKNGSGGGGQLTVETDTAISSLSKMARVVHENVADAVSMCRPFIQDPHLVKKLKKNIEVGSSCNSCND